MKWCKPFSLIKKPWRLIILKMMFMVSSSLIWRKTRNALSFSFSQIELIVFPSCHVFFIGGPLKPYCTTSNMDLALLWTTQRATGYWWEQKNTVVSLIFCNFHVVYHLRFKSMHRYRCKIPKEWQNAYNSNMIWWYWPSLFMCMWMTGWMIGCSFECWQ